MPFAEKWVVVEVGMHTEVRQTKKKDIACFYHVPNLYLITYKDYLGRGSVGVYGR